MCTLNTANTLIDEQKQKTTTETETKTKYQQKTTTRHI